MSYSWLILCYSQVLVAFWYKCIIHSSCDFYSRSPHIYVAVFLYLTTSLTVWRVLKPKSVIALAMRISSFELAVNVILVEIKSQ